jgi:hypothetical protein
MKPQEKEEKEKAPKPALKPCTATVLLPAVYVTDEYRVGGLNVE